jgi:phospholipid/cholesterol/gamma-HCH transport system permease protein
MADLPQLSSAPCEIDLEEVGGGTLSVRLRGTWKLDSDMPGPDEVLGRLGAGVQRLVLDGREITDWDSWLLTFLVRIVRAGEERSVEVDRSALPEGVRKLLDLAFAVPEKDTGKGAVRESFLARVGSGALDFYDATRDVLTFLGESTIAFGRLAAGKARFRGSDLGVAIQESGAEALGIVGLISALVGLILAFMGAVQLQLFGAEIYVADLVAIGMAREMAPLMTGVIMAGRTGAAYAAQLGTMTVNEEIDSLQTLGFSPMEFLVLPRMLALMLMMPLLTVYSNLMGMLGGFVVGVTLLGITPGLYWTRTTEAVGLDDFSVGLFKAAVIGVLVAVAGCMRGMQCGRSASAVGLAATSAVVTGIVAIVVSEAVFAVVFQVLGI